MSQSTPVPARDVSRAAQVTRDLIEWFWDHGIRRAVPPAGAAEWEGNYEQFSLPSGTWLRQLYEVREGLEAVRAATGAPRPSVALWGMSQTGKSTSVSALIDAKVVVSADTPQLDGSNGGLHWEGGPPFFFVAPHRDTERGEEYPMHWYERSLNPFNSGLDASSCLSRFVAGSRIQEPGRVHVADPRHPVQVHLVPPGDLLHALARGFDSECLGPALKGKPAEWTPERFDRMLAEFREQHKVAANTGPSREAFERMLAVVVTLADLVFGRVETFAKLRTTDADWQSRLESLLADICLVGDPAHADAFAARLFWSDSALFTERYHAMRALHANLEAAWRGKPVFVSLPATTLLLDMASCVNAFKPQQGADTREGKQQRLIQGLGWRDAGDRIVIGCGPDYGGRLGASAEGFSNFQGLVWELVVPINVANLPTGEFRSLIEFSDLLDFPGVGRDEKNETNRLNANPAALGPDKGRPCSVESFFSDIVKRGKTASIVATYSRRLSVDSFSILQNIDKDEPSNHATDQLSNGVRTWLRNMSPGFTEGAGQKPAGVSLNLGVTFWGEFVDQSKPDRAANFEMRRKFYGKLGVISDPSVATVFALNYHWMKSPRVKFTQPFRPGAALYERVVSEPEFQRLFANPVSRQSVDVMIADLENGGSGGADFMFGQMRLQVAGVSPESRAARFAPVLSRLFSMLDSLLAWRHLRAPRAQRDTRIEELDAFERRLRKAIEDGGETEVRAASYALRELLNVDPEGISLPASGQDGVTAPYIDKLLNEWKARQLQRYDAWVRGGRSGGPDWARLGVRDRDDIDRVLEALITSLTREQVGEIANLARRCWNSIQGRDEHRQFHLRRYLAMEVCNRFVYKTPDRSSSTSVRPIYGSSPAAGRHGSATAAYAAFIGPLLERQFGAIKRHLKPVLLRPPLAGDPELESIVADS